VSKYGVQCYTPHIDLTATDNQTHNNQQKICAENITKHKTNLLVKKNTEKHTQSYMS